MKLRAPPAFQVYASDDLAAESWYGMSAAERGMLDSIRRACWVSDDGSVPADPSRLAVVVRLTEAETVRTMTPAVLRWLERSPDGTRLIDPDLERQRAACMAKRRALSAGAEATNRKRRSGADAPSASPSDAPSVPPSASGSESPGGPLGDTPLNRIEKTRNDSSEGAESNHLPEDPWAREYAAAERQQASTGTPAAKPRFPSLELATPAKAAAAR